MAKDQVAKERKATVLVAFFNCEAFFFLRFFVATFVEVLNDQRLSDLFTHVMGFFLVIMRIGVSLDQSASL